MFFDGMASKVQLGHDADLNKHSNLMAASFSSYEKISLQLAVGLKLTTYRPEGLLRRNRET